MVGGYFEISGRNVDVEVIAFFRTIVAVENHYFLQISLVPAAHRSRAASVCERFRRSELRIA